MLSLRVLGGFIVVASLQSSGHSSGLLERYVEPCDPEPPIFVCDCDAFASHFFDTPWPDQYISSSTASAESSPDATTGLSSTDAEALPSTKTEEWTSSSAVATASVAPDVASITTTSLPTSPAQSSDQSTQPTQSSSSVESTVTTPSTEASETTEAPSITDATSTDATSSTSDNPTSTSDLPPILDTFGLISANSAQEDLNGLTYKFRNINSAPLVLVPIPAQAGAYSDGQFHLEDVTNRLMVGPTHYAIVFSTGAIWSGVDVGINSYVTCASPVRQGVPIQCVAESTPARSQLRIPSVPTQFTPVFLLEPDNTGPTTPLDLIPVPVS